MSLKSLFSFLFSKELNELESCKEEIEELKELNNKTTFETKYIPIKQFKTKHEFRDWLIKNNISSKEYIKTTYDCENFAIDTSFTAMTDGKWIFPVFDVSGYFTPLKMHVLIGTVIDNVLYVVDPQDKNAQIIKEERLD